MTFLTQTAQPLDSCTVKADEPVMYQYRMKPSWLSYGRQSWQECSKADAENYNRLRVYNDWEWEYESRALYAQPPQLQARLSEEEIDEIETNVLQRSGDYKDVYRALLRAQAVPFSIEVAQAGLLELYAFQEATGCDTADQFLSEQSTKRVVPEGYVMVRKLSLQQRGETL